MIKELKYLFFLLIIFFYFFLSIKHYISDENVKKTFRSILDIDKTVSIKEKNLKILENDTNNIIEYVENDSSKKEKKYFFLELLNND